MVDRTGKLNVPRQNKPVGAKPHLIALIIYVAIFWFLNFLGNRSEVYYVFTFLAAATITVRWKNNLSTIMPQWLCITLWTVVGGYLLLILVAAIVYHDRVG